MIKPKMTPEEAAEKQTALNAERERIRDISVAVYKLRLQQESGEDAVDRMLAKDEKQYPGCGERLLRNRAHSYDALTRAYLKVLDTHPMAQMAKGE